MAQRAVRVLAALVIVAAAGGCSSAKLSLAAREQQQQFLNEVHGVSPDVGTYRNDTALVRLGHAVCDDLKSGASYGTIADRLGSSAGSSRLPSQDLGSVITAAAQVLCPQYSAALNPSPSG